MTFKLPSILVVSWGLLAFGAACFAQAPGAYRIDPQSSRVEIHVYRAGMLGSLGDNHVIGGAKFSGEAVGGKDGSWKVKVHMDSGSLRVQDPGISDSTRQEIQSTMRGPTQLDVERYPAIELVSESLQRGTQPHGMLLKSELTLHGVTKPVDFPVEVTDGGGAVEVKGKMQLRLRDFGIEPISKGLGTVKVKNEFDVVYDIKLRRADLEATGRLSGAHAVRRWRNE
jgi:polyisoprenoid-binding protein YceI